jgi:hypothetical protein
VKISSIFVVFLENMNFTAPDYPGRKQMYNNIRGAKSRAAMGGKASKTWSLAGF